MIDPARIASRGLSPLFSPAECALMSSARVAVVGGGLAGLTAAWALNTGRIRTTVFEASGRLGGRVQTDASLIPGKLVEAGAELIGMNHPTWRAFAASFGLPLLKLSQESDYRAKNLRVQLRFGNTELSPAEKKRLHKALEPCLLKMGAEAKPINPLQPWAAKNAKSLDARSVAERLDEPDLFGRKSSLARSYLELLLVNDQCAPTSKQSYLGLLSALSAHRMGSDMLGFWTYTETHRCESGNQQLASRLAAKLADVRLHSPVVSLQVTGDGVRVGFQKNKIVKYEQFDYVVLAAPPTVWPKIVSAPPFDPRKFTMAHGPAVKFISTFELPFWLASGRAPSALWDRLGSVWEPTDGQPSTKKGFGLTAYSGGDLVLKGKAYPPRMEVLFPGYGSKVKRQLMVDWPNRRWIRTGNSVPAPGQVTTVGKNLNAPYQGRLFFAGEQTSPGFFGYMEGALQSGVRASSQIAYALLTECRRGDSRAALRTRSSRTPVA